jgi:4-hydroxy-tetrahydrodipicolinate synthase
MVISGDDNLTLPIIAAGGIGVISVVAQAFPKEYSQMVRFCLKGDFIKAKNLHYKIMDITDQLFLDGNPGGIKFALSLLKKCDAYVRLPLSEPNKKVKDELKRLVKNYK